MPWLFDYNRQEWSFCSALKCTQHHQHAVRTPDRLKTSWRHSCSKHWHFLNFPTICQMKRRAVVFTRTKASLDYVLLNRSPSILNALEKFYWKKGLRRATIFTVDKNLMSVSYVVLPSTTGTKANYHSNRPSPCVRMVQINSGISESAKAILGNTKRNNQDWFDENE